MNISGNIAKHEYAETEDLRQVLSRGEIYAIKALAIAGVITAHGTAVPAEFSKAARIVSALLQSIGSMGVGIFFCMSGYLFVTGTARYLGFGSFVRKKAAALGAPWLFSAVLVYFYVAVRKGGSIIGLAASIMGYLSSYWYMTMLSILYICFYFIVRSKYRTAYCIGAAVLAVLSAGLRWAGGGIIPQNAWGVYLNVCNWGIFFASGVMLGYVGEVFWDRLYRLRRLLVSAVIIITAACGINERIISYFSFFYIPLELLVIAATLAAGKQLQKYALVQEIGRASFSLYLYHELLWAGFIAHICNRVDHWGLVLIRPFGVLLCTYFMLFAGYQLFSMWGKAEWYSKMTGYKR